MSDNLDASARDAIAAALNEHSERDQSRIGNDGGTVPATSRLNPETMIAALRALTGRLEALTPEEASRPAADQWWPSAEKLLARVNDYMADASPSENAELGEASAALSRELGRLQILGLATPSGGTAYVAGQLPTAPDYPPDDL